MILIGMNRVNELRMILHFPIIYSPPPPPPPPPLTVTVTTIQSSSSQDSQSRKQFHARHNTGKFFKERLYLFKEFPELASCVEYSKVLEIGCGNGSTALPILCCKENILVYACDCSTEALQRAIENIYSSKGNRKHIFRI